MRIEKIGGFSLIELMVVIAIVATLFAYAIPNYRQYVLRSHRTEAQNALLHLTSIQERHYANRNRYGTSAEIDLTALFPAPTNVNKLFYTITMESTNTTYTITAVAYGKQADDTDCITFTIDNLGEKLPVENCW